MHHKLRQVMLERTQGKPLDGRIGMDDAYLGGERSGGKRGRAAPIARQSGRERRGDQDGKRQPYQYMIAPGPHRRKPLLMVPPWDCRGAAIRPDWLSPASLHRFKRMDVTSGWLLPELCSAAI
jgi:hypothetical protein